MFEEGGGGGEVFAPQRAYMSRHLDQLKPALIRGRLNKQSLCSSCPVFFPPAALHGLAQLQPAAHFVITGKTTSHLKPHHVLLGAANRIL